MSNRHVLVFGCADDFTSVGLKADEKAVAAVGGTTTTVSTGSAVRDGEKIVDTIQSTAASLQEQIDDCKQIADIKAIKLGALCSTDAITLASNTLHQHSHVPAILDTEPFFKTGPAPTPEMIAAIIKHILPSLTLLSATVPEVKALLDEAGIPASYPSNMDDVVEMAKLMRGLGPKNVIVKREMLDETAKLTTLHYVLCGEGEPAIVAARFENPSGVMGASYSIPVVVAIHLGDGDSVTEAVGKAFKWAEEQIKGGEYFGVSE